MIYRYIHAKFWNDEKVSRLDNDDKLLLLYLITNEHSNRIGLYRIRKLTIASELYGLDGDDLGLLQGAMEGVTKGVANLVRQGFIEWSEGGKTVWIKRMMTYQMGNFEHKNAKIEVRKYVDALEPCAVVDNFLEFYQLQELTREVGNGVERGSEGGSKGVPNPSSRTKEKSKRRAREEKTNIACARARDESDATPRDPDPAAETRHQPPSTHPGNGADEPSQLSSLFYSRLRSEDLETIVNIYNNTVGMKTGKVTLTEKRRKQLTDFLIDQEVESVDSMERLFRRTAASPFLTGQVANGNGKPFRVNFTWILNGDRAREVMEGKYDG